MFCHSAKPGCVLPNLYFNKINKQSAGLNIGDFPECLTGYKWAFQFKQLPLAQALHLTQVGHKQKFDLKMETGKRGVNVSALNPHTVMREGNPAVPDSSG